MCNHWYLLVSLFYSNFNNLLYSSNNNISYNYNAVCIFRLVGLNLIIVSSITYTYVQNLRIFFVISDIHSIEESSS